MRLRRLTLQHVRNVPLATLVLRGKRQFFVGANGQGKTNLLEAVGFLTALRSFRTSDSQLMIAQGQTEAAMAFEIDHEQQGVTQVAIRLRGGSKEVTVDNERVARLGDYLGRFPTVVFSSQDQQLVRGAPAGRRRWLDLTLAAMDLGYLRALQDYHRALAGRNALLKRGAGGAELSAFERPLATHGARLIAGRKVGLGRLSEWLKSAYTRIVAPQQAGKGEAAGFVYAPNFGDAEESALLAKFEEGRIRDIQFRSTLSGPHRDDFVFSIGGRPAREVASEGQQRTLVLALKVAQADWFRAQSGVNPLILADDVLGELDPERRVRFWSTLDPAWQIMATGTSLPALDPDGWELFTVAKGAFTPAD